MMDEGSYQGACGYGTIQTIDNFGRFRGRTTMILTFKRLIMPDGRRAPISAEIIKLHAFPGPQEIRLDRGLEMLIRITSRKLALGTGPASTDAL